ncbi:glycosyltransferase family 2 protein [Parvularcula sp. LCG005]|uniref:glycosyltransferase family 2 protein n=1 Tax=Parvularcula sp. LCG005 TaxID=3078805 RepID=UPI0029428680|nr:glycosyltransferase family 2 protein [Parvularcula sp. LCG005]WOI54517.1 glycosyltransferase family 2 protein [Parvularcula sp. LCG005]
MIITTLYVILVIVTLVLAVLAGVLLAEVLAGLSRPRTEPVASGEMDRAAVALIVPAHNEESVIAPTLANLKEQLREGDRLVVVADNCTDNTAAMARQLGAIVLERTDEKRRGKGYALQHGLDYLKTDPPTTVVFVDADCVCAPGTIDQVASVCEETGHPAQAMYLMDPAPDGGAKSAVSAFAWRFMNKTRMWGLQRLGGLTRVTGAGFAIPWPIARELALGSGEIVEDLALTVALAKKGEAPQLVGNALISSQFPSEDRAAALQHARWEHGSLRLAGVRALPLFLRGVIGRNRQAAMLGLDIAAPPLALFVASLMVFGLIAIVFALFGKGLAFTLTLLAGLMFGTAIIVGWFKDGRDVLPVRMLGEVVPYVLAKTRVYNRDARKSTKTWTRTDRDGG